MIDFEVTSTFLFLFWYYYFISHILAFVNFPIIEISHAQI